MTNIRTWRIRPIVVSFLVIGIFSIAVAILVRELKSISLAQISAEFDAIPFENLALSFVFTACSYFILTGYDFFALRHLGQKIKYKTIAPIAFSAFAVGHNLGLSSLSGGAIRYRAYSLAGLSAPQIGAVIAFAALTFSLGVATLVGATLIMEPTSAWPSMLPGSGVFKYVGACLLAYPVIYLAMTALKRSPFHLGPWTINSPSAKVGLIQLVLSSADLLISSLVLYTLLEASTDVHFLVFLSAYLLAIVIGVISTVPGAIGVFESALILLLPDVPAATLLGALLAYRLIYYLVPLILALALVTGREAIEHKARLHNLSSSGIEWGTRLLPQIMGVAVFITGAFLLVRGSISLKFGHPAILESVLPLPLLEMSHLASSAVGAGLLIVASGLRRRLQRAWMTTMILLLVGTIAALLQYNGIVHLLILLGLIAIVWVSRAEFYRGRRLVDQPFDSKGIAQIILVIIAVVSVGFFTQKHVEYSDQLWWQFTLSGETSRMLRASLLAIILVGIFALRRVLHGSSQAKTETTQEALLTAEGLIKESPSSFANVALLGDKNFLFHPSREAFIMYRPSGKSWIALSDPIGNPDKFEELLWLFRETCDRNNLRCVFYQVSSEYLPLYIELGLSFFKLGEEGVVDLSSFSLEGSHRAQFRHALNHAKRHGAEFSIVPASQVSSIMSELSHVSSNWLELRPGGEKGFSLGLFEPEYIQHFDCAIVRVEGEIVAFANLWKSGNFAELSVDLMRYTDKAPSAIMDYLFTEIMLWGKAAGFRQFVLGMAPLSGLDTHALATNWQKFGNLVYRFGEHFYNFEGLRKYKDKFEPEWEPRFLACKSGLVVPLALKDTTLLISGGLSGLWHK